MKLNNADKMRKWKHERYLKREFAAKNETKRNEKHSTNNTCSWWDHVYGSISYHV